MSDAEAFRRGYRFALSVASATGAELNFAAIRRTLNELASGVSTIRCSPAEVIAEVQQSLGTELPDEHRQFFYARLQGEGRRALDREDRMGAAIILDE